ALSKQFVCWEASNRNGVNLQIWKFNSDKPVKQWGLQYPQQFIIGIDINESFRVRMDPANRKNKLLELCDIETAHTLAEIASDVSVVEYCPVTQLLAYSNPSDATLHFWSLAQRRELHEARLGLKNIIGGQMAFSEDGRRLALVNETPNSETI